MMTKAPVRSFMAFRMGASGSGAAMAMPVVPHITGTRKAMLSGRNMRDEEDFFTGGKGKGVE
jgi:hypothetical protein